jgi:predicted HNH restriction endonuclease
MPLPNFDDFRVVWVEKTKARHGHGGEGWEFGTCLWSPTTNKTGGRIYKNMVAARSGDLVLHFYEDSPFGKELDHYFCGVSIVDGSAEVKNDQPPLPGEWAGRPQYYRVGLRNFTPSAEPLAVDQFAAQYEAQIVEILKSETDQPFIIYNQHVRLAQGKYLSRCGHKLYQLLSDAIDEPILIEATSGEGTGQAGKQQHFDYEGYVEGQRAKREAWFFWRNPRLVEAAKEHYGCQCQACHFRYENSYPGIGNDFIEVHHLSPLSERRTAPTDHHLTTLSQVTTLCANCHRMIHRLIRKLGHPVSVHEFQSHISTAHGEPFPSKGTGTRTLLHDPSTPLV